MPEWLNIVIGTIAGLALIAGAVYLAVRPGEKSWLPEPSGRDHNDDKGATAL